MGVGDDGGSHLRGVVAGASLGAGRQRRPRAARRVAHRRHEWHYRDRSALHRREFSDAIRARATGWVAACTKGGGLLAQGLTISGIALSMGTSAWLVMVPTVFALGLVIWFGRETRGRDLRQLDAS